MVSICIFAKELIYAFEILQPPNRTKPQRLCNQGLCFLQTLDFLIQFSI